MDILIAVNGTHHALPVDGSPIVADQTVVAFVGFLPESGIARRDAAMVKRQQILSQIPFSPGYTSIEDLIGVVTGVSRDTIRRALLLFSQQGIVASVRPKSERRKPASRRWFRTAR